jgi:hypothetical protein
MKIHQMKSNILLSSMLTILSLFTFNCEKAFAFGLDSHIQAGTNVSGNLIDNDTWSLAGSPYNIIGDVGVPSAYTLNIEPGVVINYKGNFKILVFGTIKVNGIEANPVTFNGNSSQGTEYMLSIRKTNLNNCIINFATFNGLQRAILEGQTGDAPQNTGTLKVTSVTINNANVKAFSNASGTNSPVISFSNSTFDKVNFEGNSSSIADYFPLKIMNCVLKNGGIDALSSELSKIDASTSNIGLNGSINTLKIINATFYSTKLKNIGKLDADTATFSTCEIQGTTLSIQNSKLISSPITAGTISLQNAIVSGSASNATLLALSGAGSTINNVSFSGVYQNTAIAQSGNTTISNCTFFGIGTGIRINGGTLTVSGSNFINSRVYHIDNRTTTNITAIGNHWNSDSPTIINSKIYDSGDDLELGTVDFADRLATRSTTAPIAPVLGVVKVEDGSGGLKITWQANSESDLVGYKISYISSTATQMKLSPWGDFNEITTIDVGNVLEYTISNKTLVDLVAVTAYDTQADDTLDQNEGHESWFSFAAKAPDAPVALAATDVTTDGFTANWEPVADATSYRIDVATDANFENMVEGFRDLEVLGISINLTTLITNAEYFYRIRALNDGGVSANSIFVTISTPLFTKLPTDTNLQYVVTNSWCDYDNDNDLDVMFTEYEGWSLSNIHSYENAKFINKRIEFSIDYDYGRIIWNDYNGDGNVDVLFSGETQYYNNLYLNNGTGSFTPHVVDFASTNGEGSASTWMDYDNDGDQDLVIIGALEFVIYENIDNGNFNKIKLSGFPSIPNASINWSDFDLDGDLDLLVTPGNEDNGKPNAVLLSNLGNGLFAQTFNIPFVEVNSKKIDWIDYNSDGNPDICIFGADKFNNLAFRLYTNNGKTFNTEFITLSTNFKDYELHQYWSDVDNDGDYDVILTGLRTTEDFGIDVLINNEDNVFNPLSSWKSTNWGVITMADYDNDHDQDLLVTSYGGVNIFENNSTIKNTQPTAPTNLTATQNGNRVNLAWNRATDAQTKQLGLNYNLYIGTAPKTQNIRPANADLNTGYRRIVERGAIQTNSWHINNLKPGTYYWGVQAIDASYAGGAFSEEGTFVVKEVIGSAPTNISLSASSLSENQTVNTLIGTFSSSDADTGDTHTYSLVNGDVDKFKIEGNALKSNIIFDYETKSSYSITVKSTDAGGLCFDKSFTITILNGNEAPTKINLSATTIYEESINGKTIGDLSTVDPDTGNSFTYSIITGGSNFAIANENQLQSKVSFDYETQPTSYNITIRSTDQGGLSRDETFTIMVLNIDENVNAAPTNILISNSTIDENQSSGTLIGTLTTDDPNSSDTHTYAFTSNPSSAFVISGSQLKSNQIFNFETKNSYPIAIRTTDSKGLSFDQSFSITINNIDEPSTFSPVNIPDYFEKDDITFSIENYINDDDGIQEVRFYHKKLSGNSYSYISTVGYTTPYKFDLKEAMFDNLGISFYFECTDVLNNKTRTQDYVINTKTNIFSIPVSQIISGSTVADYNIIAFPFEDASAANLIKQLGPYDKEKWRLLNYEAGTGLTKDYTGFNSVKAGEGYWFIVRNPTSINLGGNTVKTVDNAFSINLKQGYNLIGNPFLGTLNWSQVTQYNLSEGIISNGDISTKNTASLTGWVKGWENRSSLNQFEGAFVYMNKDVSGFKIPVSAITNAGAREVATTKRTATDVFIDQPNWDMRLFFATPSYSYSMGGIGMNESALDGTDNLDQPLLPRFLVSMDVVFEDGNTQSIKKSADFKQWTFNVPNDLNEDHFNMSWDRPLSSNKTVILVDAASHKIYDLQETNNIKLPNAPNVKHQLYYGSKDAIYTNLNLPFDGLLNAYPNPVEDHITVTIYSHTDQTNQIEIVGIDGKVVYHTSAPLTKGINFHEINFDDNTISPGVYFIQMNQKIQTKFIKR